MNTTGMRVGDVDIMDCGYIDCGVYSLDLD